MVKRLWQAVLALVLAAPIVLLAAGPASAEYTFIGNYKIIAMHSGQCVTLGTNSPPSDGSALIQWECDGHADQVWSFFRIAWVDGMPEYEIRSGQHQQVCMDLRSGNVASGTIVQQWTCNGGTAQRWVQRYFTMWNGQAIYQLHPLNAIGTSTSPSKCVDVPGLSQAYGTALQVWDCIRPNGQANQLFYFPAA